MDQAINDGYISDYQLVVGYFTSGDKTDELVEMIKRHPEWTPMFVYFNSTERCKMFNDKSKSEQPGVVLPVVVTYFKDKSFEMEIKMPPASYFIKEALNIKKGSKEPGRESAGTISKAKCKEIAEKKLKDLNANTVDQGMNIIIGSARSMGIEVTD